MNATQQQTVAGTRICTVGRDGARMAGPNYIFVGKIYEAKQRPDGVLAWRLVGRFGGTRSAKIKPSSKFVAELKSVAEHAWVDGVVQHQVCR